MTNPIPESRSRTMAVAIPARGVAWALAALFALAAAPGAAAARPGAVGDDDPDFFEKRVLPILEANCFSCHGGEAKVRGGLRLTSRAGVLKGGDLGPAVDPDDLENSVLVQAVNYEDGLEMPPKGKLPAESIAVLVDWARRGAPWFPGDRADLDLGMPAEPEPGHAPAGAADPVRARLYRPVVPPEVPRPRGLADEPGADVHPVDAFLLEKLEARGLRLNEPADRASLVRRVTFDLTGLPPAPDEVDAFLADPAPDDEAFAKLVDRLLDSPHYGEKWARHWLDVVRYAETHGYERDNPKPQSWRYRDYVIDAFNSDKPYNRFVLEQLAGDQLPDVDLASMIATGYYRIGIWDDEPVDPLQARYDMLDDVVSNVGSAFMGMSIGCARCHDHKRDPIPQRDYYRLLAFFHDVGDMSTANTKRFVSADDRAAHERAVADKRAREAAWYHDVHGLRQRFLAEAPRVVPGVDLPTGPPSDLAALRYRFYRDTWETLPDFDALKFEADGVLADNLVSLEPVSWPESFGLVFEGTLQVPAPGRYRFRAEVSDGVRLAVDGVRVIDKPGKGAGKLEGEVELAAGPASFRLDVFHTLGAPRLVLDWRAAGEVSAEGFDAPRPLTADAARANAEVALVADSRLVGQLWRMTTTAPDPKTWVEPGFDDESWRSAEGGFGVRGTPGAVVRTPWRGRDLWLRKSFDWDGVVPPGVDRLVLDLHHDEDVAVFLNGVMIHRAEGFRVNYHRVALDESARSALRPGKNVLAVHVVNKTGGQYVDIGLKFARPAPDLDDLVRRHGPAVLGAEAVERYFASAKALAESLRSVLPEPGVEIMCVEERLESTPAHVLIRGGAHAKGERVEPGAPTILGDVAFPASELARGKRLAFAEWLVRPDNPLTARVMVNRVWQYHFGRGLVPTANDFGLLGEAATHPELLDWLADAFVRDGWSVKSLHRRILSSKAYRMSSRAHDEGLSVDPDNELLWRFPPRRLQAEEVRDAILAVSGALNTRRGGPSVYPPIPAAVLAGQSRPGSGWPVSPPAEAARRSVYVHVKRSLQVPILISHDQADTDSSCPVRHTTTVPTQALGMLNGDFTNEQAARLAERLAREVPDELGPEARLVRASRLVLNRDPTPAEIEDDLALLRALRDEHGLDEAAAWRHVALMFLNANEFVYLD